MKKIPLTGGYFTLVDDEDYERLSAFNWAAVGPKGRVYAKGHKYGLMHKFIMGVSDPKVKVDHINRNRLDNQKCNLRICTQAQNARNQGIRINNTSGFKGVCREGAHKWRAQITVDGKPHYLGLFDIKEVAARAYDEASKILHGDFASPNIDINPSRNSTQEILSGDSFDRIGFRGSPRKPSHNTSGYKGVSWLKQKKLWRARLEFKGKCYHAGFYLTKEEAALAYNRKAIELHGDKAYLNEIPISNF